MSAERIAEIKFPVAVVTLAAIVDALERLHGKGLTARQVGDALLIEKPETLKAPVANPHGFGLCENPSHPEYNGQPCQCVRCRPVGYCVENPCLDCEGPTDGCQPPEDQEGGEA